MPSVEVERPSLVQAEGGPAEIALTIQEQTSVVLEVEEANPVAVVISNVGAQGAQGEPGEDGLDGDTTFAFPQASPSDVWVITHNLNRYPSVTVVDSAGTTQEGGVVYTGANVITITFGASFSGTAYLN